MGKQDLWDFCPTTRSPLYLVHTCPFTKYVYRCGIMYINQYTREGYHSTRNFHPVQSGVEQLVHYFCQFVCRCQSMIKERLHFNDILYFAHSRTRTCSLAVQCFGSEFGKLYGMSSRLYMCTE